MKKDPMTVVIRETLREMLREEGLSLSRAVQGEIVEACAEMVEVPFTMLVEGILASLVEGELE